MRGCPGCEARDGSWCEKCSTPRAQAARAADELLRAEAARAVGDTTYGEAKTMYATPADPALAETYWPEGRPPIPDYVSPEDVFMGDVFAEVRKARAKVPNQDSKITGLALGEESGEAQRALLHIHEGKSGESELYGECVQTAAMAMRLALESADRIVWDGNVRRALREELAQQDDRPRFPRRND